MRFGNEERALLRQSTQARTEAITQTFRIFAPLFPGTYTLRRPESPQPLLYPLSRTGLRSVLTRSHHVPQPPQPPRRRPRIRTPAIRPPGVLRCRGQASAPQQLRPNTRHAWVRSTVPKSFTPNYFHAKMGSFGKSPSPPRSSRRPRPRSPSASSAMPTIPAMP